MRGIILFRCQEFAGASFLKLDHIGFAVYCCGPDEFLCDVHVAFVVAACFGDQAGREIRRHLLGSIYVVAIFRFILTKKKV